MATGTRKDGLVAYLFFKLLERKDMTRSIARLFERRVKIKTSVPKKKEKQR